jgi:hypothetical protein
MICCKVLSGHLSLEKTEKGHGNHVSLDGRQLELKPVPASIIIMPSCCICEGGAGRFTLNHNICFENVENYCDV